MRCALSQADAVLGYCRVGLVDADHLAALKPEFVHRRPGLGLGELDPPPRVLLL